MWGLKELKNYLLKVVGRGGDQGVRGWGIKRDEGESESESESECERRRREEEEEDRVKFTLRQILGVRQ